MLTTKQRAFLRAQATAIDATFQIGKGGVKETMLSSIEDALRAHELVKIKLLDNCEYTPREAMDGISEALDAEQVQVIGSKIVLFKISPEHRRYDLDRLTVIEAVKDDKAKTPARKAKTGAATAGRKPQTGASRAQGQGKPGAKKGARIPRFTQNGAEATASRPPKPRFDFSISKKK